MAIRILIADDDRSIIALIPRMIVMLGYATKDEIATAGNGADALKIAKENGGIEHLISDTDMPIKNGYELMKDVKELYPGVKVTQMTGGGYNKQSEYADSFMKKPFDLDEIDKVLGKYLKKKD